MWYEPFELLVVHLMLMNNKADRTAEFFEAHIALEVPGFLVHNQHTLIYKFALAVPGNRTKQVSRRAGGEKGAKAVLNEVSRALTYQQNGLSIFFLRLLFLSTMVEEGEEPKRLREVPRLGL